MVFTPCETKAKTVFFFSQAAMEALLDLFAFEPLNKSLEFPKDFIAIPYVGVAWAVLFFSLNQFLLKVHWIYVAIR
jgi:hypothetical protein